MNITKLHVVLIAVGVAAARLGSNTQPPAPQGPDYNAFYQIGPDSLSHDGVPKGEVRGPFVLPSQAYPGTQHTYWIYVPAQYDPAVAASLMVFQDGQAFKDMDGVVRAPNVLDNLIYRREIPVMIAVFINPGRTPAQPEPTPSNWGDRDTNRPTEYNTLDDKYARVVVDELMPALYKEYNISKDPDRHGIGGASSGAIAAFTVAWQRPNDFRKVLSIVGSFVNLRGGDAYADIVRQNDRKPIRVFLQDGRNDNRGVGRGGAYDQRRDWFYQNVRLMQALTDKGYDVNYTWGINTHGQRMGGPILPEMMRWLWRDHPVSTDVNDSVERSFNAPKKNPKSPDENAAGATYSAKRMADGKQWTTQNLNVSTVPSYCYEDADLNCRRYGRLYTWESARKACQSLGDGWRLPTDDEWRQLAKRYGGVSADSADKGKAAYKALLIGGDSGFNALLGGGRSADGQYARFEAHGFYWTASESDRASGPFYNFGRGGLALHRQSGGEKPEAFSVRCVREHRDE